MTNFSFKTKKKKKTINKIATRKEVLNKHIVVIIQLTPLKAYMGKHV